MKKSSGTELICSHEIEWWLDTGDDDPIEELDEVSIDHIQTLLMDNYTGGELCVARPDGDDEYYGWWNIAKD